MQVQKTYGAQVHKINQATLIELMSCNLLEDFLGHKRVDRCFLRLTLSTASAILPTSLCSFPIDSLKFQGERQYVLIRVCRKPALRWAGYKYCECMEAIHSKMWSLCSSSQLLVVWLEFGDSAGLDFASLVMRLFNGYLNWFEIVACQFFS